MPSRTIRYMPSRTARDDDVVDEKVLEASSQSSSSSSSSGDPPTTTNNNNNTIVVAVAVSDDEETFESLDRVGPLVPRGGDSEDTFLEEAEEDETNGGDVTVLDDDDDDDEECGGNESSSDNTDSSEEAFIEVNHDDCSVVSSLTVETTLEKKARKKKKKKSKKKGKKRSRKLAAAVIPESIAEEDDGSKSEASERTLKTTQTSKTAKSGRSKKSKAAKMDNNDSRSISTGSGSLEEIVELTKKSSPNANVDGNESPKKNFLPALSTMDTISTQPTSTNAVAGSFKRASSRTSGSSDSASQSPPPVPRSSDHSVPPVAAKKTESVVNESPSKESVQNNEPRTVPKADPPTSTTAIQPASTNNLMSTSPAENTAPSIEKPAITNNLDMVSPTSNSKQKSPPTQTNSAGSVKKPPSTNNLDMVSPTTRTSKPKDPPSEAKVAAAIEKPASTTNKLGSVSSTKNSKLKEPPSQANVAVTTTNPASTSQLTATMPGPVTKEADMNNGQSNKNVKEYPEVFEEPSSQMERSAQRQQKTKPALSAGQLSKATPGEASSPAKMSSQPPLAPKKFDKLTTTSPKKPPQSSSSMHNQTKKSGSSANGKKSGTVARLPGATTHSEPAGKGTERRQRMESVASTPGAYRVKGDEMHPATDDFTLSPSTVTTKTGSKSKKKGKVQVPSSIKNLVVAAELSEDAEAKIEQEVRRRILADAVQADLVSVDDKKEESPKQEKSLANVEDPTTVDSERRMPKGAPEYRKREYLEWTLKRNPGAEWVVSVTTNQRAMEEGDDIEMEMTKVSFAAKSQREAYETGLACATPLMLTAKQCYTCKTKFAMFRRAVNCRNCGVCICSNCAVTWPSKMLPDTYLSKRDKSTVTVCNACDWVAHSFQNSLLKGNYEEAIALYGNGNINLRTPYGLDKKADQIYPIHMATIGGNIKLVQWLISERFCPLQTINLKKKVGNQFVYEPIVTSKGLTALEVGLIYRRINIVHYFVSEKGMSISDQTSVSTPIVLANLTSLLGMLPSNFFDENGAPAPNAKRTSTSRTRSSIKRSPSL